jgi:glutathione S-transferase
MYAGLSNNATGIFCLPPATRSTAMKLYYHPGSANARKVRLAAALLDIDLELQLVDVFAGAHKQPDYLAINPNGMIPVLDDNGFILWEANAIAQYLASLKPDHYIFSNNSRTRADISRWQCWDLAHWTPAAQTLVFEQLFKKLAKLGEPDAAALERGTASFHHFAQVLDAHLANRAYLVGDVITLADTSIAAALTYAVPAAIPIAGYEHIRRWFAGIEMLDAWKSTASPFV